MRWINMDEELRSVTIERCPTQRTRFFINGKPYRIPPDKLKELFMLKDIEMNKLHIDYPIKKTFTVSKLKEIYAEIDRLQHMSIT
jgi:hypothetical protein